MTKVALLYHDVVASSDFDSSGFPSIGARIYKLERDEFSRHLDAIQRANREVLMTFDDGGVSFYETIAPALEQRGWRGFFFVATNWIGARGFLTPSEIRVLRERGHVIGTHSSSHPERMSHCSFQQILSEWKESAARLADILGERVDIGSVPGGYFSQQVAEAAAAAGLRLLFTSEPTMKLYTVQGCTIAGRYTIRQGTSAEAAGTLARAAILPRLQQAFSWNTKKALKRAGGENWLKLRNRVLEILHDA